MFGFAKSDPERDTAVMLGDPKKAILSTVVPFLVASVIGQVNMLADLAWCSGLGSEYVSAIQSVTPLYWVVFDVGLGVGLGCNVIIAHRIGFGDREGAKRIIPQGIVLAIIIAFLLAPLIYLLISPMLGWMGAPELTGMGTQYLTPIIAFNAFQVLAPTLSGFLRGEGAANKSNLALITGTLVNIALDPLLIFGLGMGVSGAGLATALSCLTSTSVMLYFYLSHKTTIPMSFRGYRFNRKDMAEIVYLGVPKMLEMFMMDILDAFNRSFLIMCGGIDAVTMFSVPFRIMMLASMIPNAFAMAMTPVSSANLGAGKPENSYYAFKLCLRYVLTISAAMMAAYLILAPFLLVPFTLSESMTPLKPEMETILRVQTFMVPFFATSMVCNSMLQSMKKPLKSMFITTLRTGLTTVLFAVLCGVSVAAMSAGMVAAGAVSAALAVLVVRRDILGLINRRPAGGARGRNSISKVPAIMHAKPADSFLDRVSLKTMNENRIVTRSPSLLTGTTMLAGPACNAANRNSQEHPVVNPDSATNPRSLRSRSLIRPLLPLKMTAAQDIASMARVRTAVPRFASTSSIPAFPSREVAAPNTTEPSVKTSQRELPDSAWAWSTSPFPIMSRVPTKISATPEAPERETDSPRNITARITVRTTLNLLTEATLFTGPERRASK